MIRGILLAAGASLRMGRDKLQMPWSASTVLETTLANWGAVPELGEVLLVRRTEGAAETWPNVRIVLNPGADEGMGSSLRVAAWALEPDTEAAVVGLADMPGVLPQTIAGLIAAWRALGPGGIVAPTYRGQRGHPVVFGANHIPALRALGGDLGARSVLKAEESNLLLVPVEDSGVVLDLDTPQDMEPQP